MLLIMWLNQEMQISPCMHVIVISDHYLFWLINLPRIPPGKQGVGRGEGGILHQRGQDEVSPRQGQPQGLDAPLHHIRLRERRKNTFSKILLQN